MCTPISLPALQFVCNLVAVGTSGNGSNFAEQLSLLENQTLSNGYKLFHDVTTYKFYNDEVTWLEARLRCAKDGAQMAVIDSRHKLEYIKRQMVPKPENDYSLYPQVHAGIIRMDSRWVNANTGELVSSIPWASSAQKQHPYDCLVTSGDYSGLYDQICHQKCRFICELPIISPIVIN